MSSNCFCALKCRVLYVVDLHHFQAPQGLQLTAVYPPASAWNGGGGKMGICHKINYHSVN